MRQAFAAARCDRGSARAPWRATASTRRWRADDGPRAPERQRRGRAPPVLDVAVRCPADHGGTPRRRGDPRSGGPFPAAAEHRTERRHHHQSHGSEAEKAVGLHGALRPGRAEIRPAPDRTRIHAADVCDRTGRFPDGAGRRSPHSRTRRQPSSALLDGASRRSEEVVRAEAAAGADAARTI